MAYPHPLVIEGLLVKEEATYGTDPTPAASTDGIRGVGRIWNALQPDWAFPNTREDVVSGGLVQPAPGTPKGRIVSIDYTVELTGAGAAYTVSPAVRPAVDALLMACGLARTHSVSTNVIYDLADTGHSSATIWAYAGGKLFKVNGCRGTFTWAPTAGGLGSIRFQLQGMLASVAETALASITYDSVVPPPAVGMSLAIVPSGQSSWSPAVAGMEINLGAQVQRLDDVNGADGLEGFFITAHQPTFSFTPRAEDLSDYAAYTYAASRLVHTIDMTLGATQYNRVKLDVERAYLMKDPAPAEDQGFAAWQTEYMLRDLQLDFD